MINCTIQDIMIVEPTIVKLAEESNNGTLSFSLVRKIQRFIKSAVPIIEEFQQAKQELLKLTSSSDRDEAMQALLKSSADLANCDYFTSKDFENTTILSVEDLDNIETFIKDDTELPENQ